MHEQIFVKINAPVDKGLVKVITALNAFPKLRTISSCQGAKNQPTTIFFVYGEDHVGAWQEAAEFVLKFFGPRLYYYMGDRTRVTIEPQVPAFFRCLLEIYPGAMPATVRALKRMRQEFMAMASHNS